MPALDWIVLVAVPGLGVAALTADLIGIGGHPGFGWKQAATTAAVLLVLVGATRIVRQDRRPRS